MAQADAKTTRPNPAAQFETRGYVLSEDEEFAMRDIFAAMDATAFAYDMDDRGTANFDLTGDQVAAVLRTYARLGKIILGGTPFANRAMARTRDIT